MPKIVLFRKQPVIYKTIAYTWAKPRPVFDLRVKYARTYLVSVARFEGVEAASAAKRRRDADCPFSHG